MSGLVVTAEKMAAGGDAISHLPDGRVVFVAGLLPGESASIDVHEERRDYAKASVREVVHASPDRVVPPCPFLARGCGGCPWQHIAPAAQLPLKMSIVTEALARTGGLVDAHVVGGGSVDPWAYRTTMRLAVGPGGRLGLRAARSHQVVVLDDCLVAHPRLAEMVPAVRARGTREVTLRTSVAGGERTAMGDSAKAVLRGLPADVGTGPRAVVHECVAGATLQVSAASFFQSGPQAAELLVEAVRTACAPDERGDPMHEGVVLDGYGGVGLFSAALGIDRPIVVESSHSACADAAINLAGSEAVVVRTTMEAWDPVPVSLAIVDPARSGLGVAATERIVATDAARIVLVSCDPVSLARDARLLDECGYAHVTSEVLDLFPHTPHVEVVSRFRRRDDSEHRVR